MKARQAITAIIYDKKGNILSIGKNSYVKTHPLQAKFAKRTGHSHKVFLHAEIDAIIKCRDIDKAYRIFVSRVTPCGKMAIAKPCPVCQHAISLTPIKKVEHT